MGTKKKCNEIEEQFITGELKHRYYRLRKQDWKLMTSHGQPSLILIFLLLLKNFTRSMHYLECRGYQFIALRSAFFFCKAVCVISLYDSTIKAANAKPLIFVYSAINLLKMC